MTCEIPDIDDVLMELADRQLREICASRGVDVETLRSTIDALDDDAFELVQDRVIRRQGQSVLEQLLGSIEVRQSS